MNAVTSFGCHFCSDALGLEMTERIVAAAMSAIEPIACHLLYAKTDALTSVSLPC